MFEDEDGEFEAKAGAVAEGVGGVEVAGDLGAGVAAGGEAVGLVAVVEAEGGGCKLGLEGDDVEDGTPVVVALEGNDFGGWVE